MEPDLLVEGTTPKEIDYFCNLITNLVPDLEEQGIVDSGCKSNPLKKKNRSGTKVVPYLDENIISVFTC